MGIACRFLVLVLLILGGREAHGACPKVPNDIWRLADEADLIVVGEAWIESFHRDGSPLAQPMAHLSIDETLKGPEMRRLEVAFQATSNCPLPQYLEGKTVVAFLVREEGAWRTIGSPHATLHPQGNELKDVKTMTRSAVEIQQEDRERPGWTAKHSDWYLRAAALPGTRWDGLLHLELRRQRAWERDVFSGNPRRYRFHRSDLEKLTESLVRYPRQDLTFAMMVDVLGDHEDPRIDRLAFGVLEGLLVMEEPPPWLQDLLWAVLGRYRLWRNETRLGAFLGDLDDLGPGELPGLISDPECNVRAGRLPFCYPSGVSDAESWTVRVDNLRKLWVETKVELGLPDVPPAHIDIGSEPSKASVSRN